MVCTISRSIDKHIEDLDKEDLFAEWLETYEPTEEDIRVVAEQLLDADKKLVVFQAAMYSVINAHAKNSILFQFDEENALDLLTPVLHTSFNQHAGKFPFLFGHFEDAVLEYLKFSDTVYEKYLKERDGI